MRDHARRRLRNGAALLLVGILLGGGLVTSGLLNPVVTREPTPIGAGGSVVAEEAGEVFAIFTADPESRAEGCRATTANGRAVTLVRAPSTERIQVREAFLHPRLRFEAPVPGRITVVCPNPAGTMVGPDDLFGVNGASIVIGLALGLAFGVAGLVLVGTAVYSRPEDPVGLFDPGGDAEARRHGG